jgi:hypothetical protein
MALVPFVRSYDEEGKPTTTVLVNLDKVDSVVQIQKDGGFNDLSLNFSDHHETFPDIAANRAGLKCPETWRKTFDPVKAHEERKAAKDKLAKEKKDSAEKVAEDAKWAEEKKKHDEKKA